MATEGKTATTKACRCVSGTKCSHTDLCCGCCNSLSVDSVLHIRSISASAEMCSFAFEVLCAHLSSYEPALNLKMYDAISDLASCGVFVTYNKLSDGKQWDLRGCIGTLKSQPLRQALRDYAITAATLDRRFLPIEPHELSSLQVGISLLDDFETLPNGDLDNWIPGTHGLVLDFTEGSRSYSATFLPEIAMEQGWTRAETLQHLIRKSGYRGVTSKALKKLRLTRYLSSKYTLTFQEFLQLRSQTRK
mmetsp:Transcript_11353/g.20520  ORF Transcript_11353/g.20520 Transcript_11353/m.20520 type:complete len:248 (+) Transcript_11353:86-829(+)